MPSLTYSRGNLTKVLNVAIALAALFLCGVLIKNLLLTGATNYNYKITPQARLAIKGVNWSKSEKTILLALKRDCRYCSESADLYRRLAEGLANRTDTKLIGLLPENETNGPVYFDELRLPIRDIHYVSLSSLGIRDVPSLVTVDRNGRVTDIWVGKLSPRKELDLFKKLNLPNTRPTSDWLMDEEKLRVRIASREPLVILDIRDRAAFAKRHKQEARNIPLDELTVRAVNELPIEQTVVISGNDESDTDLAYTILDTQGFTNIMILSNTSRQSQSSVQP